MPGLASPRRLIYMDLQGLISCLTAHGFLLPSLCWRLYRDKGVCSVPPVFSQRPIRVPRASRLERGRLLKSRESRDLAGSHAAVEAGAGLGPALSPLAARNTHSFLPFPHHGAGGLPEG